MRLTDFRIRNFRSIVDSGWNRLSSDNISALIGQNESGKTSVLEALYSFYNGQVSEDVLRSDLSMPEVSCIYAFDKDQTNLFDDTGNFPEKVVKEIREEGRVEFTRQWLPDMGSRLFLSGVKISETFENIISAEKELTRETVDRVIHFIAETDKIEENLSAETGSYSTIISEIEEQKREHANISRQLKKLHDSASRDIQDKKLVEIVNGIETLESKAKEIDHRIAQSKEILEGKESLRQTGKSFLEMLDQMEKAKNEMEDAYQVLLEIEASLPYLVKVKEKKAGETKLFGAKEKYINLSRKVESLRDRTGTDCRYIRLLMDGKVPEDARKEADEDYIRHKSTCTAEESGEILFRYVPGHEFFEDFSSLLPNRIDLEDIFENNHRVEGYKAVRNFLIVAGLDPDFFKQTNNRILKQKIENLNNEVTVDFQEYWRQNVGKSNKIRINFELEHYDITHPEKMGKPYLEFWIKDQHERLYPKQRSRGVRWFLSFYLELKAFASGDTNSPRLLLIDEPGLSLHAMAQEDVLKVFEDIKESMQIIYTTHSPHMIDHGKLYRLLAVQRANENNEQSETVIIDAASLHAATPGTLSPVFSVIGTGPSDRDPVRNDNNIIVEDITHYYYLNAICRLLGEENGKKFIPAGGQAGITTMANLLTGWGFGYSVLLFNNERTGVIFEELKKKSVIAGTGVHGSGIIIAQAFEEPEDLFSTLDFKKHIIQKRMGMTGNNSSYLAVNNISRNVPAALFYESVLNGRITSGDLDSETMGNFSQLTELIGKSIRTVDGT